MIQMSRSSFSLKALSHSINRPSITFAAIAIALALGAMRFPFLQYLRPIGDFYIALLKICVLPFLLSTIPLAVRSAMGQRIGRRNAQVVGYLDRDYDGGRRPRDGRRYKRNLPLHVRGRTNDREDRRIGGAIGRWYRRQVCHQSKSRPTKYREW